MPDSWKDKIAGYLISGLIGFLFLLLATWGFSLGDSDKELNDKLNQKADINYVDAQNLRQDRRIETVRTETREDLKEINTKLDRLIELQLDSK